MKQELKHIYYFEPEASTVKKGSPGEKEQVSEVGVRRLQIR